MQFDPINDFALADHSIGTKATGSGQGTEASTVAEYQALINNNNLAQNSSNYVSFAGYPEFSLFDPNVPGIYTIQLSAFIGESSVLETLSIDVVVTAVPEPATVGLMLLGLSGIGLVARRRRAFFAGLLGQHTESLTGLGLSGEHALSVGSRGSLFIAEGAYDGANFGKAERRPLCGRRP